MRTGFSDDLDFNRYEPATGLGNDVVTEDSAAREFVRQFGNDIRFCHSHGAWFRWNGVYWAKDETGSCFNLVRELCRRLGEDLDERGRRATGKTTFCGGVERFARSDPRVAVTFDYWDADPWMLGTPGGIVDLRTGQLLQPCREQGITRTTLTAPLTEACPRWLRFLAETTGNDGELISFIQQWCGYCLTGVTREHALVFVYGPGGNGKSVFLNVVTAIIKDYAATATMEAFTASRSDRHSTEIAMLRGARLVTASETEQGRAWAESRIKQMTGGDPITARFMRQDNFTFLPTFKLMLVGNHRPTLHNVDDAARRRFNIVPFDRKPAMPDRELEHALLAEAPAILQWMIEGCLDWQRNGLSQPAAVKAATESYFSEQDMIGLWIEECCDLIVDRGPNFIWDKSANLFGNWSEFAVKAGELPGSQKAFGQALQKRGLEPYREPNTGSRGFRFIRLKAGQP